jgi:hypothetical protein
MTQHKTNKRYTVDQDQTCGGCKKLIPAGSTFLKDVSRTPWHADCKRLRVNVSRPTAPRYLVGDPTGKQCDGCGETIKPEDEVVHKNTLPWHSECVHMYR